METQAKVYKEATNEVVNNIEAVLNAVGFTKRTKEELDITLLNPDFKVSDDLDEIIARAKALKVSRMNY